MRHLSSRLSLIPPDVRLYWPFSNSLTVPRVVREAACLTGHQLPAVSGSSCPWCSRGVDCFIWQRTKSYECWLIPMTHRLMTTSYHSICSIWRLRLTRSATSHVPSLNSTAASCGGFSRSSHMLWLCCLTSQTSVCTSNSSSSVVTAPNYTSRWGTSRASTNASHWSHLLTFRAARPKNWKSFDSSTATMRSLWVWPYGALLAHPVSQSFELSAISGVLMNYPWDDYICFRGFFLRHRCWAGDGRSQLWPSYWYVASARLWHVHSSDRSNWKIRQTWSSDQHGGQCKIPASSASHWRTFRLETHILWYFVYLYMFVCGRCSEV